MNKTIKFSMELKQNVAQLRNSRSQREFAIKELPEMREFISEDLKNFMGLEAEINIESVSRLCCLDVLLKCVEEIIQSFDYINDVSQNTLLLILNEAVSNAVFHGNLKIPEHVRSRSSIYDYECQLEEENSKLLDKKIMFNLKLNPDKFRVIISDSGEGFDFESILNRESPPSPEKETGRGIFILRNSVDLIEYSNMGKTLTMEKEWRTL